MRLEKKSVTHALAAVLVLGILAGSAPAVRAADTIVMPVQSSAGAKQNLFRMSMRKLWAEHVIWTHGYVVATIAGSRDAKEIEARLLRNQTEIGAAFAPYYGQEVGTKLAAILTEHIHIAGEVVKAAKKPTSAKYIDADKRWHENTDELAAFLSGINPNSVVGSSSPQTFTVSGSNNLTVNGTVTLNGATLSGTGGITANGPVTLGPGNSTLDITLDA